MFTKQTKKRLKVPFFQEKLRRPNLFTESNRLFLDLMQGHRYI